jgi:hypothetical protein
MYITEYGTQYITEYGTQYITEYGTHVHNRIRNFETLNSALRKLKFLKFYILYSTLFQCNPGQ